ncbi:MAG: UDP-glucose 6-dehydrogenase, partial [Acidimicrobiia bacterium]
MQVAIIGAGYVGLVTGGGLASLGHRVRLGEVDSDRVARLDSGDVPIFEHGLPDLLSSGSEQDLISYHTSNVEAAEGAD